MENYIIILLLPLTVLFSCTQKQEDDIQGKAQNLIINKYSNIYTSKPQFEFINEIVKYDKEKSDDFDSLLKYTAIMDERNIEDIGYVLRYIAIIDGYTFMFIATFDKEIENIITNNLYENALYSKTLTNIEDVIVK